MKLSAPVYILKQRAKALSRREDIPLHAALDRMAKREGFRSWSSLSAAKAADRPTAVLYSKLRPGDLVLLGARPGQGKTLLGLELALTAISAGRHAAFFTLDFTADDVGRCAGRIDAKLAALVERVRVDTSDEICADYIASTLSDAPPQTLVVIDYLQLLDQRRSNPELSDQLARLRSFAKQRRATIVCLSQIDRNYDPSKRPIPSLEDVRMPNPIDLNVFHTACFLHAGQLTISGPEARS